MANLKFGEIAKQSKHTLEDETDYTPRHYEDENYKLGLVYKELDDTWGKQASEEVRKKINAARRWDLPIDILKNVHCSLFTQANPKDENKLWYMIKITFSTIEKLNDPADEKKVIKKYQGWPDQIKTMVGKDAQNCCGDKLTVKLTDKTKEITGYECVVGNKYSNTFAPSTSAVGSSMPVTTGVKMLYTFTKLYRLEIKDMK